MATPPKAEYPPLYAAGLHEMTLADLRLRCVDGFPLSQTRDAVMRSLEAMCLALSMVLLRAEVWVDGSFLTQKIEPEDVDVVVMFTQFSEGGTPEQQSIVQRIRNQNFHFPVKCDSYVNIQYPEGHRLHWTGEYMRAYWIRQFGFSRGNQLKGIAVIRTPVS